MPGIWPFNNVSTADDYSDATTAQFPTGKPHFSLQVYNAAIYYQLIRFTSPNNVQVDATEHFLAPVLAEFDDVLGEGLAVGDQFGGIRIRSAVAGVPAKVTVI